MSRRLTWKTALVLCALPGGLRGGQLPDTFTLGRYVPDTCWLYVHEVHNPERAYIEQQWSKVFDAFLHSGIDQEVKNLVTALLPKEEREEFEQQWTRITELCKAVSWGDLVHYESTFAEFLSPGPTYLLLFRGTPGSGEKNTAALGKLLEHVATLDARLQFSQTPYCRGFNRSCLTFPGTPFGVPFCIDVFRQGDMIGICTSPVVTQQVFSLAAGEREVRPIVEAERFRQALASLPDAEDSLAYFDFKALAGDLESLLEQAFAKAAEAPEANTVKRVFMGILQRVDAFDYLLTVQQTDGLQERKYTVATLQPDRMDTPFAKVFANRKPLQDPYRFIPTEAMDFSVSVGLDLDALYALVLDVIRNDIPDGEALLQSWAELQDRYGFHVQEDLLDWLSGEMINVELPAARPTPMSYTDGVTMIRVKAPVLARQKVDAAIARMKSFVRRNASMELLETPAAVEAPGFRTLVFPPLATFVQPVVGLYEDWLIIGGSAEAINACLATTAGKRPNILANERFRQEGILRNEPVSSVSFSDLSHLQQELAGVFQAVGVFGGVLSQAIRDPKGAKVVQSAMAIIHRLAPVVAQIDFYSSKATYCTFDGRGWQVESVSTYKGPATAGR